jgi:hypothetical protein
MIPALVAFRNSNSVSALQGITIVSEIFLIISRSLQRSALFAAIIIGFVFFLNSLTKVRISESFHSFGFFEASSSLCKTSCT